MIDVINFHWQIVGGYLYWLYHLSVTKAPIYQVCPSSEMWLIAVLTASSLNYQRCLTRVKKQSV